MNPKYLGAVLAICYVLCAAAAQAANDVHKYVRIPIFFVTDRNMLPAKTGADTVAFGPHRRYVGHCKHDSYFGTAYCVVENTEGKRLNGNLANLGWAAAQPKENPGAYAAALSNGENAHQQEADFFNHLQEMTNTVPDKNIFVFVHGYNESFDEALLKAAGVAYHAERPLILYSWPSVSKLCAYESDENNIEWSQFHFNKFVESLQAFCAQDPARKIRMVSHSMGNRLVLRASPLFKEQKCFAEFAVVCPDVDQGVSQHYAASYFSDQGMAKIRLYMSRRDKALALSQLIHGGYKRLGEQATGLVNTFLFANRPPGEAMPAGGSEFDRKLAQLKQRLQTIDFTDIDTGFLGHTVPAKLICRMSFTNSPPDDLCLAEEASGQTSKLSKFFARLTRLGQDDSENPVGCLRVVKASVTAPEQPIKKASGPAEVVAN